MAFEERTTTKKGNQGELIVDKILRKAGYVIYTPEKGMAHAFDRLAVKNKESLMIVEVKTKAQRNYFPDTGFDLRHYREYKTIMKKHNLEVVVMFVDEKKGEVYGGRLSYLEEPDSYIVNGKEMSYPTISNGIIYFHISRMRKYGDLTHEESSSLLSLTTKSVMYA